MHFERSQAAYCSFDVLVLLLEALLLEVLLFAVLLFENVQLSRRELDSVQSLRAEPIIHVRKRWCL